ncbi:MAG TPA: hypothetical protein VEB66_16260 [Opitutaceae bacterium]|nr:hypothetical protein [Opitutaceae bacterium]
MKTQMSELTPTQLQQISGGGEWWGVGTVWSIGGGTLGLVAGIAGSLAVAPAIVGFAVIAGAVFVASGSMVLMLDRQMDAQAPSGAAGS